MGWVSFLQRLKQQIQRGWVLIVLFHHPRTLQHKHQHFKGLLLLWRLTEQVQHQGRIQRDFRFLPKGVVGRSLGRRGIFYQIVHQLQHVRLLTDIAERVIAIRLPGMDQIKHLDVIALTFQEMTGGTQHFPLGIDHQIRAVGIHQAGLAEVPRLAGATAAHHENV